MTPDVPFQGHSRTRNYFEGWYFKIVVPEQNLAYAFIPGISYDAKGKGHAFLQLLNGTAATSAYHRYPTEDFQAERDRFVLDLGPHHFATDRLVIDLPELKVDLHYTNVHPWPRKWYAPGIMGWYGFVPRMQCYHGLVSAHHGLRGSITVAGKSYDAAGGIGYTEKDWGSGFPEAWVWGQSNHFSGLTSPASLMFSVAKIPWFGVSFVGFLAIFLFEGELHYFTTWARSPTKYGAGARVQTEFTEQGGIRLTYTGKGKTLTISGVPNQGGDLASPVTGAAMTGKINESLTAELDVTFTVNGETRYDGTASWAGLEVSSAASALLASR